MEELERQERTQQESPVTLEDIRAGMSEEQKQRALAEILRVLREER